MILWYSRTGVWARPAFGFPFLDHRACGQINAELRPGMFSIDHRVGLDADQGRHGLHIRAGMPDAPCFRCGSRGWCGHGGRVA